MAIRLVPQLLLGKLHQKYQREHRAGPVDHVKQENEVCLI